MYCCDLPDSWSPQATGAVINRNLDFSAALATGDSIASVASVLPFEPLTGAAAPDLVLTNIAIGPNPAGVAARVISLTVSGGSYRPGSRPRLYLITATVTTAGGETLQLSAYLTIQPC